MSRLFRFLTSARWALPINLLLATLIGYQAVRLLMNDSVPFVQASNNASASSDTASPVAARASQLNLQPLLDAWLFGKPQAKRTAAAPPPSSTAPPPETRLNFRLEGIYYSPDPQSSMAAIRTADGKSELYVAGASLPGGVQLHEIQIRHVILFRGGRYETLRFPEDKVPGSAVRFSPDPPKQNATATTLNMPPERMLAYFQQRLKNNPQQLARLLVARPTQDKQGQFIGYSLSPGKNPGLFKQFGLESGDILTAVNGTVLDSPLKGLGVIQQLATADHLDLQILRNGSSQLLSFQLPN